MRNIAYVLTLLLLAKASDLSGQSLTAQPRSFVSPQLVSTLDSAILLAPDGSLWLWGGNHHQQAPCCLGISQVSEVPERFGSENDWRSIAASFIFALAVKADGSLWGWGWNYSGQLGRPKSKNLVPKPIRIGLENDWAQISVGAGHCLALKTDGSLWAWGQNEDGQVGDGTTKDAISPIRIGSAKDWKAIAASGFGSYALKRDHSLWAWGDFDSGHQEFARTLKGSPPSKIGAGTNWTSISAGDFFVLALKADGTLWIGGPNAHSVVRQGSIPQSGEPLTQVGERSNWAEVFAGAGSFFARKSDGRFFACGQNACRQLGLDTDRLASTPERVFLDLDPWAFAAGWGNTLALTKDGKLLTWGKRLGSDKYPAIVQAKQTLNNYIDRYSDRLPFRIRPFDVEGFTIDHAPFVLWELPAGLRRSILNEGVK
jgi:alpha-tubulin suppressor-like RCC1 family protein